MMLSMPSNACELCYADARTLRDLLLRRKVSAVELTEAVLARIDQVEGRVNAYITLMAEPAMEAARRCDAELAAGQAVGPLHGIPLALKDLYDTAGVRTTAGSKILGQRVPERDATTVARLRAAGAVIIGKTNMNEFAAGATTENPHYGDTHNPWGLSRVAGGSSGGSAAAVAAGMAILSTGSDTGGSVRIPAALCGVVGLKPSFGRISCHGLIPLSWELDHPGPITRTVYDAALVLGVVAGWDASDPRTLRQPVPDYAQSLDSEKVRGVRGMRIGVDPEFAFTGVTAPVRTVFEAALNVLTHLGAEVIEVSIPRASQGLDAALTILKAESAAYHAEWLRARPEDYDPSVLARLQGGVSVTGIDYANAQRLRRELTRDFELLFEEVDLFATPMCGTTAPKVGQKHVVSEGQEIPVLTAMTRLSRVFNLTGLPAISLPCGFDHQGLPVGLQLAGPRWDELAVLRAAHAYEQATDWHEQRPVLAM
jgi:aspartyl-tRNA(Asn)/glutamyl-tRNA(Gln) amidotransferase subunit A